MYHIKIVEGDKVIEDIEYENLKSAKNAGRRWARKEEEIDPWDANAIELHDDQNFLGWFGVVGGKTFFQKDEE